jgi:hypothetical protein
MKAPWTLQVASDVIRDGLGIELLNHRDDIVAEVFRCDADLTVTVRVFEEGVPDDVLADLVARARATLDRFEDGTPLPEVFAVEHIS